MRRLGESYTHPLVVLIAFPNGKYISRIGFAGGRSLGNAVRRNRAKRRLREAMRPLSAQLADGFDVLLLARAKILEVEFTEVEAALKQLLLSAGLDKIS